MIGEKGILIKSFKKLKKRERGAHIMLGTN